jgi:hypothetical protein
MDCRLVGWMDGCMEDWMEVVVGRRTWTRGVGDEWWMNVEILEA